MALQRIKRTGLGALTPTQGLEALQALLLLQPGSRHLAQAAAVSVEWSIVLKVTPTVSTETSTLSPCYAISVVHYNSYSKPTSGLICPMLGPCNSGCQVLIGCKTMDSI